MAELNRKCPYCAEEVKAEAMKCKHCGSELTPLADNELKRLKQEAAKAGHVPYPIVFLVLILCGVWIYFQANDAPAVSSAPQSSQTQTKNPSTGRYYMSSIGLGCATEALYERAFSMMVNDEWELVAEIVASGRCVRIEEGTRVHIEDSTLSMVKVRPAGSVDAYWTGLELPVER